jgi:hypothetical protein
VIVLAIKYLQLLLGLSGLLPGKLVEVLLGMGARLGARAGAHVAVDLVPVLAVLLQSFDEEVVLLVGPPTGLDVLVGDLLAISHFLVVFVLAQLFVLLASWSLVTH